MEEVTKHTNDKKRLIIFGVGEQAQLAHYFFSLNGGYTPVAFTIDSEFISEDQFCGLPIVPFENIASYHPPEEYSLFVAVGYSQLNKLRMEKYLTAKRMGYSIASYISPQATIFPGVTFGENCFILEDNTIQPFVTVGNNVTLWSGNHIGHHSLIADHCFITSHVVVSGGVKIEESCFIGVNATLRDHITIGKRSIIGAGALILTDVEPEGVYIGQATERSRVPSRRLKNI